VSSIESINFSTWGERLFFPQYIQRRAKAIKYYVVGEQRHVVRFKKSANRSSSTNCKKCLKKRLSRIANHVPEVMVKITGSDHSAKMLKAHIDYISRNGDIALTTEHEEQIHQRISKQELQQRWGHELTEKGKSVYAESYHIVFSMPPNTPRIEFRQATEETIKKLFAGHQYYYAEHQDTEHPHVHVVVKALDINGKRLSTKKADLHRWRQYFAHTLREHGVQAEATKRAQRAKILKADKSKLYQLKKRGQEPILNQEQRIQQQEKANHGINYQDSFAIKKARKTRYAVIHIYNSIIKELDKSSQSSDKQLVMDLKKYLKDMKAQPPAQQIYYNLAKAELEKANKIQKELQQQQRIIVQSKDKDKQREL
jgi:hypothetical protein